MGCGAPGIGLEAGVDGVADLAFQRAQGFFAGLAFGQFLLVVGVALAVPVADLGDRGHVDGVVEPAVAAPGQPPDLAAAGGHLDGGGAVAGGDVVPVREASRDDHAAVLKVWSKRHKDLGRIRTQVACRLHQVLCELVPGGVPGEITAAQAERILASITPAEAVQAARWELAAERTEDLRGIDARIRQARTKLAAAVRAAGTSLTRLFGVGPVIAAAVIGDVGQVARFPDRDHFAAYNGTAPIEVSSGGRKIWRLSRRGNRRLNHAIHMAAITQISHAHSDGRAYYERKIAAGKTCKEALRCLKRQISDAIFACLQADARRAAAKGPGGQPGNHSVSRAASSHPKRRLFGQATPGPATTLRPATTEGLAPSQRNRALRHRAKNSLADLKKPATTT